MTGRVSFVVTASALAAGLVLGWIARSTMMPNATFGCIAYTDASVNKLPENLKGKLYHCQFSEIVVAGDQSYIVFPHFAQVGVVDQQSVRVGCDFLDSRMLRFRLEGTEPNYADYRSRFVPLRKGYEFRTVDGGLIQVIDLAPSDPAK